MRVTIATALTMTAVALAGCQRLSARLNQDILAAIAERQQAAIAERAPVGIAIEPEPLDAPDRAYEVNPTPVSPALPSAFEPPDREPPPPDVVAELEARLTEDPTTVPTTRSAERYRDELFTLTDALAYAQRRRREYQTAREDLYLAALALMLERHLWTPQFAAELRGVYGNFGEITDFDQAVRFVADLAVAQRLPYGGEFTAQAISTIIRDVKRNLTAVEGSEINLGLRIPLLRGAGYVAQETLIELERNLTYAVRTFERFRRAQLVIVADGYFNLLQAKQAVIDAGRSVDQALYLWQRAFEMERQDVDEADPLDTRRAQQRFLTETNRLEQLREAFRFAGDQFKLLIGMPVDEPLGLDDLETIQQIEEQIEAGRYPLLRQPPAVRDQALSVDVAQQFRLDLLNALDQIGDAQRGVKISENALLPTLDWFGSVQFPTDPEHFRLGHFEVARANWRTEVVLQMDDRYRERLAYRTAHIDLDRAQRDYVDDLERVRVEVRRTINEIRLQERLLQIQQENLRVAEQRLEYSQILYENGDIGNRDLVEAQDELINALNQLAAAKTELWTRLLEYRLATGTLRIDEHGAQSDPLTD